MDNLNLVSQIKFNKIPQFKGENQAPQVTSLPEIEPDTFELSNKPKKEEKNLEEVITTLFITAGTAAAGIFAGKHIYNKHFEKLACGIKKGEINDALYNFIKNNDKKGKIFNNKNTILEINENLDDNKLIILKQLAKIKETNHWANESKPRFYLTNIKDLLNVTTDYNIKYLEQLANKTEKVYGTNVTLNPEEIYDVLQHITSKNEKVASQLIDSLSLENRVENLTHLKKCLDKIDKENIDIWQMLLSSRESGGKTELNLERLPKLAKKIQEKNNPQCAEILLNAKKKNGSGLYIHNEEEILSILETLKDDNAEIYKKFYDMKAVTEIDGKDIEKLLPKLNNTNIDIIEELLTKKVSSISYDDKNVERVLFQWEDIEGILKEIKDNDIKQILKDLINITNKNEYITTDKSYLGERANKLIVSLLKEFNENPQNLQKANNIIKNGIVDGKQTLDLKDFAKLYYN